MPLKRELGTSGWVVASRPWPWVLDAGMRPGSTERMSAAVSVRNVLGVFLSVVVRVFPVLRLEGSGFPGSAAGRYCRSFAGSFNGGGQVGVPARRGSQVQPRRPSAPPRTWS